MAHHGGGGKGVGGLVPPTGPLTAAMLVFSFCGFIWLIFKHPRVAGSCVIAGFVFAVACRGGMTSNPLITIAVIWAGCELAEGIRTTKRERVSAASTPTKEN